MTPAAAGPQRSPRDQLGRRGQQPDHRGRRKPVRGLPGHARRALHNAGRERVRAGPSHRRSGSVPAGRAGRPVQQPDVRNHLQHVQRRFGCSAPSGAGSPTWTSSCPAAATCPRRPAGFGAVFTDVDQPDGNGPGKKHGNRKASTLIEYFGVDGKLLFSSFVPASPGDASLSFFGIVFDDALIARVRITSGDVAPGPDDGGSMTSS